ncbi:DinB family protein [Galbibacter sp. EGI 63066]|uniref:DinB family protein n=1 Tax=Galbibacter sp. EGI 63066 TaxID=2993559 RepID=UPI0022494CC7|nr:DinB family protein [Galbibacter sp. EGI 63066]MCX2678619.1 DinB family protein [Galbibacter sp. EGI 63066]
MKRQEVLNEIKITFSNLKSAIAKFSEEDLNRVPFEGSWTAGQITQHIIICASGIPDEKTKPADRPYDEKIKSIRDMFLDMEIKFKTAPILEPENPPHSRNELTDTLNKLEDQHTASAQNLDMEALCLDMELPTFGHLTRYEWIRFMMVHTQRHTKQIENIYNKLKG